MTQRYTDLQISTIAYAAVGFSLRQEYQPKAIASLANAIDGSKKVICGCGGGKTLIMALAIALQVRDGLAKTVVVTAPSIRLCRQLEYEFIDVFSKFKMPDGITFFNVSSDGKKKSSDLDNDDIDEENIDVDDDGSEIFKSADHEADVLVDRMGGERKTSQEHDIIEDELQSDNVTIFFVCKPSFLKNFRFRVATVVQEVDDSFEIDITAHDEFHNYISANKKDSCKVALKSYSDFSRNSWFFSASKRSTERLTWKDALFGELVIDVPASDLVKWGYLVPKLRIYIVTAGMISKIEDPVMQKFSVMHNAKASDFMREAKVVLKVMEHQAELGQSAPKILHFSKRVAFTKEMHGSKEFKARALAAASTMTLFQMDGSTHKQRRDGIFGELKSMTDNQASCLLQHSICREGINCPNFDVGIIARGMSEISLQQALGRIQRFYAGKECAYLYIYTDDKDYEKMMKELATFIHYGLGDYECTVEKLIDDNSGSDDDDDDNDDTNKPNLSSVNVKLKDPAVFIKEHTLELIDSERKIELDNELDNQDDDELISGFSFKN